MEAAPKKSENRSQDGNPLAVKEPVVARFSRRMAYMLALIASAILAFTLMATFAPRKKAVAQANPEKAPANQKPDLPAGVDSGPDKYSDLLKKRNSSYRAGSVADTSDPRLAPGGAADAPQPPTVPGTYDPRVPGVRQPTPEEQARNQEKDQLQKEAASAGRSPVAFSDADAGAHASPQQSPKTPELVVPAFPLHAGMSGGVGTGNGPEDQNMQGEKRSFTEERKADFPYVKTTLITPISKFEVKAGSILPAILLTGINSDLPGQMTAQIREHVYDTVTGNYLLIPQGTRLIGEYDSKIAYGQERVLVVWTRLIMPNGNSISLEGMPGTDLSGYAGVTGKVNNHYGKLITGVVLGSIIGAGAQIATGGQGAPNVPPSFGQLAVSGAATNINQTAQQYTQKNLNLQPTIEVSPGDKINVFVTKDMILTPFTE